MFSFLDDEEGSWADPIKLVKEIGDGDGSFFLFRFTGGLICSCWCSSIASMNF